MKIFKATYVSGAMVTNQAYYEDTNKKIARLTEN